MNKFTKFMVIALLTAISLSYVTNAQVAINTDQSQADASAMLDVKSTTKGFLFPRLTTSQRDAISNPAAGLIVYNSDVNGIEFWNGSAWYNISTGLPYYIIGSGGSCTNTTVNGNYEEGTALDGTNTIDLDAIVTFTGPWSITTNTVNGYSYSGSGTFTTKGSIQITLDGTGTPVTAQTDVFIATANFNGGTCSFSVVVAPIPCGSLITFGQQTYGTVQIGTQCWMAENLNVGTRIDGTSFPTDNGIIEKWCYNNDSNNCNTYGGLYPWDEMMKYVTTEGAKGICPPGWHLPTDSEWCTLEDYVDAGTISCNEIGWRGTDAGGKLKQAGTIYWETPNTGATNSTVFTALPAGYRNVSGGFNGIANAAHWWASGTPYYRYLSYDTALVSRLAGNPTWGLSVRCIRN